jgi:hypothetical protein
MRHGILYRDVTDKHYCIVDPTVFKAELVGEIEVHIWVTYRCTDERRWLAA